MSTTISGNLKDLAGANASGNTFLRFRLRGLNGNVPRVNGTALIPQGNGDGSALWFYDFTPNASGAITGTLYSTRDAAGTGNGEIEAGGSLTAVWYGMVLYVGGIPGPEIAVHAKIGATLDISNVTPITATPVITAPTGDTTYARLDAGNAPFTGQVVAKNGAVSSPGFTFASSLTTGFWRQAADVIGTSIAGVLKWLVNSAGLLFGSGQAISFSSNADPSLAVADTGLSRVAAGTVAVGNGTQGDASGTLKAVSFQALNTSDGLDVRSGGAAVDTRITIGRVGADSIIAIPGIAGHFATNADEVAGDTVIRNENSTGRVYIGALPLSGILPVSVDSAGLNIYGATSGSTKIAAPAVASGSNSLQAVNDTFVYRATTDTLQNKSIKGLGAAGNNTLTLTPGQQIFAASGTFTIPTGVTSVKVTIVGGGGAGGGATAVNNGGGGGSGGSAIKWLTGLTPGNTIAVTVGAGGTGVSGAGGNNGAASSIASGTQVITTVTANGGGGGLSTGAISGGGLGAAISTNGDINNGGGGGGYSNGGTGGGHGGASMFGGGPPGAFSTAGTNATVFGAGGAGAGGGVNAGGNGGGGIVIVEWTN